MKLKRVYLDTSVLIAEFDKKEGKHKLLTKFLDEVKGIKDIELCSSKWALTEMYDRLTKNQIEELKIVKYLKDLLDKNKIRTSKFKLLDVSPNKNYDFNQFFNDLSKDLVKYKTGKDRPGLGDIIHIRIMKNNRVNKIVTFDTHFENIQGFTCINPLKTKYKETN
jgi:predicted nucleic acid-binding protein